MTETIYDRVGGEDGLHVLVERFYERMLADPSVAGYFTGVDLDRLQDHQRRLFAAALGGPDRFAGRGLAAAHAGLGVTEEAFDRLLVHLRTTLEELEATDVAGDVTALVDSLRGEVVEPA